jgi:hypothetical protein
LITAAIAQLGERQTEDLKVPGSIPGLGTFSSRRSRCPRTKISRASRPLGGFSPDCIQNELLHPRHTRPVLAYRVDTSKQPRSSQEMATVSNGPPTFLQITGLCGLRLRSQMRDLDTLGIEPRASRMLSGCDTTTPCARLRPDDGMLLSCHHARRHDKAIDSCGVRTHALSDWRLKPAP